MRVNISILTLSFNNEFVLTNGQNQAPLATGIKDEIRLYSTYFTLNAETLSIVISAVNIFIFKNQHDFVCAENG